MGTANSGWLGAVRRSFDTGADAIAATTFRAWSDEFVVRRMRLALLLLTGGNLLFLIADRILHANEFALLVEARLLLCAQIAPLLAFLWTPWARRIGVWLISVYGIVINVFFARSLMFEIYAAVTMFDVFAVSSFFLSLALGNLTIAIMVPLRLGIHVMTQLAVVAYYVWWYSRVPLLGGEQQALFNDAFHGLWIWLAADALVFVQGRVHRREFDARRELEGANAELAAANRKLSELDRLKSDFFANISHELRTPLTLIVAAFERLLGELQAPGPQQTARTGLRNASQLLVMINELLDLAKFEGGHGRLRKRGLDLAALVRQVAGNFDVESSGRRVLVHGADEPLWIEADPRLLKKVLYNLISNAVKFSDPQHGRVDVELGARGDDAQIVVRDDGIGIPPDELAKIFDRFQQAKGNAVRGFEGSGIGLALVKEVVDQHDGRIGVTSTLGEGSAFTVTLPVGSPQPDAAAAPEDDETVDALYRRARPVASAAAADEGPPASSAPAGVAPNATRDEGTLILIAEDNPDLRGFLADLVGRRYRTVACSDGVEALAQARKHWPDLVVTDLMMPRMRGDELLAEMRRDENLDQVPVIFLTAQAAADARVEVLRAGADDYLLKPFHEEELFARIANLLKARQQERDLEHLNVRLEMQVEQQLGELVRSGELKRFLPRDVAERIVAGELDAAQPFTRQRVTALFADLVGYTELTSQLEPEEAAAILNEYLGEMTAQVVEAGGLVDKFVGDAVMAMFGAPQHRADAEQVRAAVRAARGMQARVAELSRRWRARGVPRPLYCRIGIHTGFVTVGVFGSELLQSYTAVGTPINVAARLQNEAEAGTIVVGDASYVLVEGDVPATPLGARRLRGIPHPIEVYRLEMESTDD